MIEPCFEQADPVACNSLYRCIFDSWWVSCDRSFNCGGGDVELDLMNALFSNLALLVE